MTVLGGGAGAPVGRPPLPSPAGAPRPPSTSLPLWSLGSLLPETPERTLLYGLDRRAVPGLAGAETRRRDAAYDAAVAVLPQVPEPDWLWDLGTSLRADGWLLLATRSHWSRTHGGPRLGMSPGRLARLLARSGYVVDRTYGLRPGLVLPEHVVCLDPAVSTDFWSNLFRPWSAAGALAAGVAGRVPAVGVRAFPWLVARARWQGTAGGAR